MAKWRYVGWFSSNPLDVTITPTAVIGQVESSCKADAFDEADRQLDKLENGRERINWYVERVEKV